MMGVLVDTMSFIMMSVSVVTMSRIMMCVGGYDVVYHDEFVKALCVVGSWPLPHED